MSAGPAAAASPRVPHIHGRSGRGRGAGRQRQRQCVGAAAAVAGAAMLLRGYTVDTSSVNTLPVRMRAEVAVVTGASRGIGRAIALALGGEGAKAGLFTAMSCYKNCRICKLVVIGAQPQEHLIGMTVLVGGCGVHAS